MVLGLGQPGLQFRAVFFSTSCFFSKPPRKTIFIVSINIITAAAVSQAVSRSPAYPPPFRCGAPVVARFRPVFRHSSFIGGEYVLFISLVAYFGLCVLAILEPSLSTRFSLPLYHFTTTPPPKAEEHCVSPGASATFLPVSLAWRFSHLCHLSSAFSVHFLPLHHHFTTSHLHNPTSRGGPGFLLFSQSRITP